MASGFYTLKKTASLLRLPPCDDVEAIDLKEVLFDLENDPHEMNNLLGSNPERAMYKDRAEELRESLLEWLKKNNSKYYNGVKARELI